jgi:hypothetical protein
MLKTSVVLLSLLSALLSCKSSSSSSGNRSEIKADGKPGVVSSNSSATQTPRFSDAKEFSIECIELRGNSKIGLDHIINFTQATDPNVLISKENFNEGSDPRLSDDSFDTVRNFKCFVNGFNKALGINSDLDDARKVADETYVVDTTVEPTEKPLPLKKISSSKRIPSTAKDGFLVSTPAKYGKYTFYLDMEKGVLSFSSKNSLFVPTSDDPVAGPIPGFPELFPPVPAPLDVTRTDIPKIALHDLSVMFPLDESLLTQDSPGRGGLLLTDFEVFHTRPEKNRPSGATTDDSPLRAVSFRLDPCFPSIGLMEIKISACIPQIRIIFQRTIRVKDDDPSLLFAEDFTVHGIYDLTRPEFETLVKEVIALGDHSPEAMNAPLGVHPRIAKEGMSGPTAKAMKALMLRFAGRENLNRVARMTKGGQPSIWQFAAFDVKDGKLVPPAGTAPEFASDEVGLLIGRAAMSHQTLLDRGIDTAAAEAPFVSATAHFGNPYRTTAGINATCGACHTNKSNETLKELGLLDQFNSNPFAFKSNRPLAATFPKDRVVLAREQPKDQTPDQAHDSRIEQSNAGYFFRMFGYLAFVPAVRQRTVNETAAIADALIRHGYVK